MLLYKNEVINESSEIETTSPRAAASGVAKLSGFNPTLVAKTMTPDRMKSENQQKKELQNIKSESGIRQKFAKYIVAIKNAIPFDVGDKTD